MEEKKERSKKDEQEIKISKSSAVLKCILTEDEKRKFGDSIAQAVDECSRLEDSLKSVSSEMKSKIAEVEARLKKEASLLRQGYEYRDTPIEIIKNFKMGTVSKTRMDTGEQYEERAMTGDERQTGLPLPGEDKKI